MNPLEMITDKLYWSIENKASKLLRKDILNVIFHKIVVNEGI